MTTYRWNGKHGKGAMKAYRERKRLQAETRNEMTKPERRSSKTLGRKTNEELTKRRGQRRRHKKQS